MFSLEIVDEGPKMRLDRVGFGQTTGGNQTNLVSVWTSQAVILSCQPKARIDNQKTKKGSCRKPSFVKTVVCLYLFCGIR